MRIFALTLFAVLGASAQQSIDVSSKSAVLQAAHKAVWPLKMFYDANKESSGAWMEQYGDGHWLVQWHESGIYWDLFYKYMQYSGDTSYLSWVDSNMQESAAGNMDFLDGMNPLIEMSGRWNDDIAWWALSVATAAETFGINAVVAKDNLQSGFNPKYFDLANNTFYEIFYDWDSVCQGGIYWSRDKSSPTNPHYKSTITNVQEMELGAHLYGMTGLADYKLKFDQIYAWMTKTGVLDANYIVYDGVSTSDCSVTQKVYSYESGILIAALARMYNATKDATYLTEAHNVFSAVQKQFVDANQIISIEPSCVANPASCKSPSGYFWSIYKGLADLYQFSNDAAVQASIAAIMRASAVQNFKGCDSNWYCIRNLAPGTSFTLQNGTNPRDQFETIAILNSLARINGASAVVQTDGSGSGTATKSSGGWKVVGSVVALGGLVAAFLA
ncbi:hydrolase 76 protein [Podochytrium sp. JEL0797]|nr:hydrolase 76 protein [Podochytrium sp. JEL0797]